VMLAVFDEAVPYEYDVGRFACPELMPATIGLTPTATLKLVPETTVSELLPCPSNTEFPLTVPMSETVS